MAGVAIYADLTPDVASAARAAAERIRVRMSRTAADIVAIGNDLREIKAQIGHGNFLPWIEAEFGMAERTARNFMSVADKFKSATVADLPPTVLYALAAASMPEEVRQEAVRRAETGEPISLEVVATLKRDLVDARQAAKDAKRDERVQKDVARQAIDDRAAMLRDLEWARSKVDAQAQEIERLKQDGVIHVYPREASKPEHAAVQAPHNASLLPTAAAIIADGCRRDVAELIGIFRSEGLFNLAQELESLASLRKEV